jgi:hypothetical protein
LCFDFGGLRAFMGGCGGAPEAAKSGCCVGTVADTVVGHYVLFWNAFMKSICCVETVTGAVVDHVLFRDLILKIGCCGCPSLRGVTAA